MHLRKSLEEFYYKGEQSDGAVSEWECVRFFCFASFSKALIRIRSVLRKK